MITTVLSFLLVLGVLIFIHELGHFIAARHVGVKVEAFSIGFPPTALSKKIGETKYIISWVPIGGYVKLFGQNVTDENKNDPTNYASKSILQRLYILIAGPLMNLLFALIFMPIVFWMGVDIPAYLKNKPFIQKVEISSYADKLGLAANDKIISINGNYVNSWETLNNILNQISPSEKFSLEFERAGNSFIIEGSAIKMHRAGQMGWSPKIAPIVGGFTQNSPAKNGGIQSGDIIKKINGQQILDWSEISPEIQKIMKVNKTNKEKIFIELERKGEPLFKEVLPYFEEDSQKWFLGMRIQNISRSHSFKDSLILGIERLLFLTKSTFNFLGQMIIGDGSVDDLGGPIKIGIVIGEAVRSSLVDLFFLMSFISLQLGIFNLLPIPALDGGHIFMLLLEKLKGGPLSKSAREKTQLVGFSILISLMIFVTWNDVMGLL
tara:strand:+ start:2335 stop:3642 length:1308 start_codon:yes stop_codon:yes gene_type:complete